MRGLLVGSLVTGSAALLTACSGADMMSTIGLPTSQAAPAHGESSAAAPGPPPAGPRSNALVVTDRQRSFLDGLAEAGVRPSSDLLALSIGSYVCQAQAAQHTDQELWDSVYPMVRGDADDRMSGLTPPAAVDVDAETSDYIRIATDRLC
ncbi:DUF732 domain-containing protein [Mycolicibacterium flavescens]|nr:DUF732 domain-containing protein [Mycolicibacterium flavescens]